MRVIEWLMQPLLYLLNIIYEWNETVYYCLPIIIGGVIWVSYVIYLNFKKEDEE